MQENDTWEIKILDPKVKGLLKELEHLQLIEIYNTGHKDLKNAYLDKLQGKNLLDMDTSEISID